MAVLTDPPPSPWSPQHHAGSRRTSRPRPSRAPPSRRPPPPRADQAPHRPPPLPVRPRPGRALGRGRRRGRARLPRRPARRRRRALRRRARSASREVRALTRAQRLQAARRRGARGALPGGHAHGRARSSSSRAACAASTAAGCTRRTSPRCATRCAGVARPGCLCLVRRLPACPTSATSSAPIVDGDATSAAIAAASIVAKVTRDRFMHRADALHPGWEFARPRRLLDARAPRRRSSASGVSPLHRLSFQSDAYQQLAL